MDTLRIPRVIAVGHSWGSMTILRAADRHPERFQAIGFCNMPFTAGTRQQRRQFGWQHLLLPFRRFYTKQAAKALYGKQSLSEQLELLHHLRRSMNKLPNRAVRTVDTNVIVRADDAAEKIQHLGVPALALKGQEDYVPVPPAIELTTVAGGHVSPLEAPEAVFHFAERVIALKE